ncbi:MAG: right-handed parallel beta-helix repeat-containing protein [Candidatus Hydrogenedentota bacterium]
MRGIQCAVIAGLVIGGMGLAVQPAQAETFYVCPDGCDDEDRDPAFIFETLEDALDATDIVPLGEEETGHTIVLDGKEFALETAYTLGDNENLTIRAADAYAWEPYNVIVDVGTEGAGDGQDGGDGGVSCEGPGEGEGEGEGEEVGDPTEDCPDGPAFSQPPVIPADPITAIDDAAWSSNRRGNEQVIYDDYDITAGGFVDDPWLQVRWWGIRWQEDGDGPEPCTEEHLDNPRFTIEIRPEDSTTDLPNMNLPLNMPEVQHFEGLDVIARLVKTVDLGGEELSVYEYETILPEPIRMKDAWISIAAAENDAFNEENDCLFGWLKSEEGTDRVVADQDGDGSNLVAYEGDGDAAFCMKAVDPPDPTCPGDAVFSKLPVAFVDVDERGQLVESNENDSPASSGFENVTDAIGGVRWWGIVEDGAGGEVCGPYFDDLRFTITLYDDPGNEYEKYTDIYPARTRRWPVNLSPNPTDPEYRWIYEFETTFPEPSLALPDGSIEISAQKLEEEDEGDCSFSWLVHEDSGEPGFCLKGAPVSVGGDLSCPGDPAFSQPPEQPGNTVDFELERSYEGEAPVPRDAFDLLDPGEERYIYRVSWWGGTRNDCGHEDPTFRIEFYRDEEPESDAIPYLSFGAIEPEPVCLAGTPTVDGVEYTVNRYTAVLPLPVRLESGAVSIMSEAPLENEDAVCEFYWANAQAGEGERAFCLAARPADEPPEPGGESRFQLSPNSRLTLEGFTLRGVGAQNAVLGFNDSQLIMDRVLVRGFTAHGIDLNGSTLVAANSIFAFNGEAGLRLGGGASYIGQCTMLFNTGPGIQLDAGNHRLYGSLLVFNSGLGIDAANGVSGRAVSNLSGAVYNGGEDETSPDFDIEDEVDAETTGVVFAANALFPGDLAVAVPARDALMEALANVSVLARFGTYDFEREPRRRPRTQVGADYQTGVGALDLLWTYTDYEVDVNYSVNYVTDPETFYIGQGATLTVNIYGEAANNPGTDVQLVPEAAWQASIPAEPVAELAIVNDGDGLGHVTLPVSATKVGGQVIDGRMRVYLDVPGEPLLGKGAYERDDKVTASALERSDRAVIDTTPPVLTVNGSPVTGDATLSNAVAMNGLQGEASAPGISLCAGEGFWPSGSDDLPMNNAALRRAAGGERNPQVFLNSTGATVDPLDTLQDLSFRVEVEFTDYAPEDAPEVEVAGFPDYADAELSTGDTAGDVLTDNTFNTADTIARRTRPHWADPFSGDLFPDDRVALAVLPGQVEGFSIRPAWTLSDLVPADRINNDNWMTEMLPVAVDRAFNKSSAQDYKSTGIWWLPPSPAEITSPKNNGAVAEAPSFTFGLDRPTPAPSGVSPADPAYSVRLWAEDPAGGWEAIDDRWSCYSRDGQFRVPEAVYSDQEYENRFLMITVAGVDEAGNVQPAPQGEGLNGFADLAYDTGSIDLSIDYDFWFNPGLAPTLETRVIGEFFYDRPPRYRDEPRIGPEDVPIGSGPQVPFSAADPILARFTIAYQSATPGAVVRWHMLRDGVQVPEPTDVPPLPAAHFEQTGPNGIVVVELPYDYWGRALGDDAQGRPEEVPPRAVDYRFVATVISVADPTAPMLPQIPFGTPDPSPAVKAFTVYPPGEAPGEEQPVKFFERR